MELFTIMTLMFVVFMYSVLLAIQTLSLDRLGVAYVLQAICVPYQIMVPSCVILESSHFLGQ